MPCLSAHELDQYEKIVNMETIDIYTIVTGQESGPHGIQGEVLERLRDYAGSEAYKILLGAQTQSTE